MTSDSNNKNFDKDEWVQLLQWIKDGIAKDYINHHYYNEFQKIKYIGSGGHCKVYRATWKNRDTVVALKSFEINDYVMKEMVNEILEYADKASLIESSKID
ncbi:hypothetical protein RclHR1_03050008 [Rhizophagus clarus]|uniref:Protein kinase domain-containing protein n=1 Tax=Rhizophagus clarus TaxID=94130 RepID=A0A2Z6RKN9_9GLOM|nr:hypothetical protein RclHR1_03050008 [Rhizophagus clarus]